MDDKNRKRIQLKLSGAEGISYQAYPLTFGVPFKDGDLKKETTVRVVDESGETLPIQTQCLTTWNSDQAFIKWLLVDLQADLPKNKERMLFLEYPAEEGKTQEPGIRVEETTSYICVDTGVMRIYFRNRFEAWQQPRNSDTFLRCQVKTDDGWQNVFRGNPGPFLYMKDQEKNIYDSYSAGLGPQVVVEETGPLRTCVRIKGYHTNQNGLRFCPYILRVHLFAGKSDIRIFHTFIYDQDPHTCELSAVGMKIPLNLGNDLRACFGLEGNVTGVTNWRKIQVLQSDDLHYTLDLDGNKLNSGKKAAGWASLNGSFGGAVAVIKNFWQEYPKGFILDEDGIDVQIWPERHSENLIFSTPFEEPPIQFGEIYPPPGTLPLRDEVEVQRQIKENSTAPLSLKSLHIQSVEDAAWVEKMMEEYAKGRTMTYNDTGTSNGIGASKTTEIYLRISGKTVEDVEAETLAQSIQNPLVTVVDPVYVCKTNALGHFFPAGDNRFSLVDQDIEDVFKLTAIDPVTHCRLYGMMRYGNMVCAHSEATGWVYLLYKESNPEKALRYIGPYNNEAVDQIMAVWGHFVWSGKREHLLIAQNYARCVADVAFVHAHPTNPENVGVIHYHNGHLWSGAMSTSHSIVSGILMDYYMTGNRRLLDVATEAANRVVLTQEPAGILSTRKGGLHRDFTGPLSILLDLYQATWKEEYGELARLSFNWLLRTSPEPGRLPNKIFTKGEQGDEAVVFPACHPDVAWGNKYYLYEPALRLMNSKTFQEFLVAEADYWVEKSPKDMLNYQCTTICFAYNLTGDIKYAAYGKQVLEGQFHKFADKMRAGKIMDFQALWFSGFIPQLMRTVADAMERDPEGFLIASEAWWKKRCQQQDRKPEERPDEGPEIHLGKLSRAPHPA